MSLCEDWSFASFYFSKNERFKIKGKYCEVERVGLGNERGRKFYNKKKKNKAINGEFVKIGFIDFG
jgi:hypothetical protein